MSPPGWMRAGAVVLSLAGCRDFADVVADGRCGNGVLEQGAGEECDTFATDGARCGEVGSGACHFVCDDASCPAGFSCGGDDICRRPSARFDLPATLPLSANALIVAEFDGDGRDDLVAIGDASVEAAFPDADGVVRTITRAPLALPERDARVGDLDGDGRADLLLAMTEGIQLLRGTAARGLLPLAPPVAVRVGEARVQAVGVPTTAPFLFDEPLFAGVKNGLPNFALSTRQLSADSVTSRLTGGELVPLSLEERVGQPPRLGFGVAGGDEVLIASVACAASTMCAMPLDDTIALPPGSTLARRVFFGDVDGDKHNDAVVEVNDSSGGAAIAIARGGPSGFEPAELRPELRVLTICRNCPPGERPLQAVADLTGDGIAEFILRDGVQQSNGTRPPTLIANAVRPWAASAVVDVNDDGFADVVGVGPFALDVILSRGDGVFINRRVGAGAGARSVAAGDFDGDLTIDIALLDIDDFVIVLFSNEGILEGDVAIVGQFPGATSLTALRDVDSGDGIDDLLIMREAEGDPTVYLARGTSARQVQTLLPRQGRLIGSVAAGHFRSAANVDVLSAEIVVSPTGPQLSVFLYDGTTLGESVPAPVPLQTRGCTMPSDFDVDLAARDLNNDGVDEIVLIEMFRTLPTPPPGSAVRRPILVGHVVDDTFVCDVNAGVVGVEHPAGIVFADVDSDGDDDLVVPLALDPNQRRRETPQVGLALFKNTDGALAEEPQIAFGPGDVLLTALRPFRGPRGALPVVAIDGQVVGLQIGARGSLERVPLVDANGGLVRGVAVGDVNGDGLDDIVVNTTASALVYPQGPCPAGEVCL